MAVALSPNNPQLYGLMAAVQWASFNIEGMVTNNNRAIELAPDLAHPYRLHGMTQMVMGNSEGVLADANQAIELDPTYYAFYMLRATAHQMQSDPQAALADLGIAIDLNPGMAFALECRLCSMMTRVMKIWTPPSLNTNFPQVTRNIMVVSHANFGSEGDIEIRLDTR